MQTPALTSSDTTTTAAAAAAAATAAANADATGSGTATNPSHCKLGSAPPTRPHCVHLLLLRNLA